ncbi:MAG: hypothetical protein BYD32DRAFT_439839 [Podila humilis]|nr:MAG: hypothetical protein BYD32DRAFT_439836 [Podila humilis]KAI9233740.1 MAG: hypothetical protein BYD32DRAFT_439839 [Podila humilis]
MRRFWLLSPFLWASVLCSPFLRLIIDSPSRQILRQETPRDTKDLVSSLATDKRQVHRSSIANEPPLLLLVQTNTCSHALPIPPIRIELERNGTWLVALPEVESSVDCLIGRSEVVLGLLIEGVIPAAGLCFLVSGCDVYCPFPCNRRVASAVLYLCAAKLLDGRGELIHHVPSSGDVRSKEKLPIFHQLCGYQTVV